MGSVNFPSLQFRTQTTRELSSMLAARLSDSYMMRKSTAYKHTLTETRHRPSDQPSIRRNDRRYQPPHPLTKTMLATLLPERRKSPSHPTLRTNTHTVPKLTTTHAHRIIGKILGALMRPGFVALALTRKPPSTSSFCHGLFAAYVEN